MTKHDHPIAATSSIEHAAPDNPPADIPRPECWSPAKQAAFLRELSASHCVKRAALSVGMSRQSAYKLRARLKGEPFDLAWTAAFRCRFDALAEMAMDRAMNGVEVPHLHKGEVVHTSRRYDERVTGALLAMRESFRSPHVPSWHGASSYPPDDFRGLVERVEHGPETWREEKLLEYEAVEDDCEEDEDEALSDYERWLAQADEDDVENWDDAPGDEFGENP